MNPMAHTTHIRPALRVLAAVLPLAALLSVVLASANDAGAARTNASKLGNAKGKVKASCPKTPCEAVGSVTGYQKQAAGRSGIFKVPAAAKIVAWSVDVSKPSTAQESFFGSFYEHEKLGTDPYARLAVIRRKKNKDGRFKLTGQSPKVELSDHLGSRPLFALRRPMKVAKGDVVAITVPTWAPVFDVNLSNRNTWVASRPDDKCSGEANIKAGRPQQKLKSLRRYGCTYSTARLAYWAYYVPNEQPEEPKKGDGKKGDGKN